MDWQAARSVQEEIGQEFDVPLQIKPTWPTGTVKQVEEVLYELRSEYRGHLKKAGEDVGGS